MKSWQLCSVWRQAKLNNVRPEDDDDDDDEEEDDYGGDDGYGNSVTYEWLQTRHMDRTGIIVSPNTHLVSG